MQYSNNESTIAASHHYMAYNYNQQYDNGNQMSNNASTPDDNDLNSGSTFRELREVPRERDRRDRDRSKYDRDISRDRDRRRERGQERSSHRVVPIVADYNYYYDEAKSRGNAMTSSVVVPTETYPQNYVNYNADANSDAANYPYYNNEAATVNTAGVGRGGDNGGENSGDEFSFEGSNDSSYHDRHRRGRDRDRDRGRDRDYYDRDRDRDRGGRDRTRNRDRDHERNRGRDRDRDRDRDRNRDRDRSRDRSRDRDRERDRDWDRDYSSTRRDSYPNSWKDGTPNHTIMLRTLPLNDITKNDIRYEIAACGLEVKDVRLLRTRKGPNPDDKGSGRGFGFVEFKSVGDAMKFMEAKQGMLVVDDRKIPMHYSIHPKDEGSRERSSSESNYKLTIDWDCVKCGAYNFRRRDQCFKCSTARDDAELSKYTEGHDEFSTTPRNTLLFGNLDALTTEETILVALQAVTSLPIKSIRIAKDPLTNTSRGFCYVELNSTSEAIILHNHLQNKDAPFYVDDRKVLVSYSKQSFYTSVSATSATVASTAVAAAQWTNQVADASVDPYGTAYSAATAGMPAYGNAASYYDQQQALPQSVTAENSIPQATTMYQQQYYGVNTSTTAYSQVGVGGGAATTHTASQMKVTSPSLNHTVSSVESHSTAASATNPMGIGYEAATISAPATAPSMTSSPSLNLASVGVPDANGDYTKYPVPDVSTYQFDQSTNYYYDSSTGLYYDASSQYYYNSHTQQFLFWDSEKQSYLLAPTSTTPEEGSMEASADAQQTDAMPMPAKKGKDKDRQDKVKIAKKIAKDMEKWAKMLNQKKENAKQGIVANQAFAVDSLTKQPATADAGFAILEKKSTLAERQAAIMEAMRKKDLDEKKGNGKGKDGLVPEYGGGSDTDEDGEASGEGGGVLDESRLTDWQKLACLLCKRMFPSKEALVRHQQLSDLHKQNLEALRMSVGQQGGNDQESKYRDRAKERREKYGEPDVPQAVKVKDKFAQRRTTNYEEPTKHGIGSSNIGNKMLKAMGWNEGQGLGKTNQGRTNIIEAQRRVATAGLGLRGSNYGTNTGDTYKETVKKMMQTRYNELE